MTETGWTAAEFIAEHQAEESPAARAVRLARQGSERQDRAELTAAAERAATIEDERERRLFQFGQLGIGGRSPADIFAGAQSLGDEDAEYEDCAARMAKIDRRRASRLQAQRFQAEQLAQVQRAASSDPLEQAAQRAHQAFAEHTRSMLAAAAAGAPQRAGHPFASRGVAARAEQVTCAECRKVGATAEQSFLIHQDPDAPMMEQLTDLSEVAAAAFDREGEQAKRRTSGRYAPVISR